MNIRLELPYPPSVNHYWRSVQVQGKRRILISKEGREYRRTVKGAVLIQLGGRHVPITDRIRLSVHAFMPDRRKRDLDNLTKAILDSLQHAGVYVDDGQIDDLRLVRGPVMAPGWVEIEVSEMPYA